MSASQIRRRSPPLCCIRTCKLCHLLAVLSPVLRYPWLYSPLTLTTFRRLLCTLHLRLNFDRRSCVSCGFPMQTTEANARCPENFCSCVAVDEMTPGSPWDTACTCMRPTGTVLQTRRESSRLATLLRGVRSEREDSKRREVRLFHSVLRARQVRKKKLQVSPGATCDPPTVAYFSLVAAMSAEDRHTFTVHVDSKIRRGGWLLDARCCEETLNGGALVIPLGPCWCWC